MSSHCEVVIENKQIKSKKSKDVSETLITKILLGTLGCVPAFDTYLKNGLKKENIKTRYSKKTLRNLLEFYNKNKQQFEKFRKNQYCKKQKKLYPPMKIIDMYFWNIGKK